MRQVRIGLFLVGAALGCATAGCGSSSGEVVLEKKPQESVGQVAQALGPARIDCNTPGVRPRVLTAQRMIVGWTLHYYPQKPTPIYSYQNSISNLLTELASQCPVQNPWEATPGQYKACDQYNYSSHIFSNIPGASGYYYKVYDTADPEGNHYWLATPVVDITTQAWYSSYPGAAAIHTPGSMLPATGSPQYGVNFWLDDGEAPYYRNDHTSLWDVAQNDPYNSTANGSFDHVRGKVKPEQCVIINDMNGAFLDFAPELEEHDPTGCSSCIY